MKTFGFDNKGSLIYSGPREPGFIDHTKGQRNENTKVLPVADFDGKTYDRNYDFERLTGQNRRVFDCMKDGVWKTLFEIEEVLGQGHSQAGISARLRDLRKEKFGGHTVARRRRGNRSNGLFEYRLIVNDK